MERRLAKELLHVDIWLTHAGEIVRHGKGKYLSDAILQEAGDSLMMKLGEAAGRLSRWGAPAPGDVDWVLAIANRNFIIHQYDAIDREQTWLTLSVDFPAWHIWLRPQIAEAKAEFGADAG